MESKLTLPYKFLCSTGHLTVTLGAHGEAETSQAPTRLVPSLGNRTILGWFTRLGTRLTVHSRFLTGPQTIQPQTLSVTEETVPESPLPIRAIFKSPYI